MPCTPVGPCELVFNEVRCQSAPGQPGCADLDLLIPPETQDACTPARLLNPVPLTISSCMRALGTVRATPPDPIKVVQVLPVLINADRCHAQRQAQTPAIQCIVPRGCDLRRRASSAASSHSVTRRTSSADRFPLSKDPSCNQSRRQDKRVTSSRSSLHAYLWLHCWSNNKGKSQFQWCPGVDISQQQGDGQRGRTFRGST